MNSFSAAGAMLALVGMCLGLFPASAEETDTREIVYRGIRPTDPGGRDGLRNPERGLRIETKIAEAPGAPGGPAHHLKGRVSAGYTDDWLYLDAARYESDGLTIAQMYCYLDQFTDRPLTDAKVALLQRSLDRARQAGVKALLRFAYERTMGKSPGPDVDTILGHMDQLAPVIEANRDVIYVLQAGFVGAWGEWHSSAKGIEKDHANLAAITAKLIETLPLGGFTQVRVPKYKRWVLEDPAIDAYRILDGDSAFTAAPHARIGFHNDGFLAHNNCGGTWTEPPHFSNPGNPEFDYMTVESPYLPVDGELFWSDQGGVVEGLRAAVRMRLHHYSTFSIAHSFSEREGKPFSVDLWKRTALTQDQVGEAGLPASNSYFLDADGAPVPRTEFEYIRDHLGYRIELQRARFPEQVKSGESFDLEIEFINRGFATIHNPRPVYLAFIAADGTVNAVQLKDVSPRDWQPHVPGDETFAPLTHTVTATVPAPQHAGPALVGLWLPDASERLRDDARYAVRVANGDVPWWVSGPAGYGINVLGGMAIAAE
ncbi:MAG: DUF4832 domain-containing protein [bacterium]|nr:DUF4832 domain-containing protein [bacterium]